MFSTSSKVVSSVCFANVVCTDALRLGMDAMDDPTFEVTPVPVMKATQSSEVPVDEDAPLMGAKPRLDHYEYRVNLNQGGCTKISWVLRPKTVLTYAAGIKSLVPAIDSDQHKLASNWKIFSKKEQEKLETIISNHFDQ